MFLNLYAKFRAIYFLVPKIKILVIKFSLFLLDSKHSNPNYSRATCVSILSCSADPNRPTDFTIKLTVNKF